MQRPLYAALAPALLLTLYGAVGSTLLALLAGLVARALAGPGLALAAVRVVIVGVAFISWLYAWRRLTLWLRDRECNKGAGVADTSREAADTRGHSG